MTAAESIYKKYFALIIISWRVIQVVVWNVTKKVKYS